MKNFRKNRQKYREKKLNLLWTKKNQVVQFLILKNLSFKKIIVEKSEQKKNLWKNKKKIEKFKTISNFKKSKFF